MFAARGFATSPTRPGLMALLAVVLAGAMGGRTRAAIDSPPTAPPGLSRPIAAAQPLPGAKLIAAGDDYSMALLDTGTVFAWGHNHYGQLGDDSRSDRLIAVPVKAVGGAGRLKATAIAAGRRHSLAIRPNGTVVAWGDNFNGQLGDGTTTDRITPVAVKGPGGRGNLHAIAIAAGQHHSLAIRPNGSLVAWGRNFYGQLGDNTTTNRITPTRVKGIGGTGFLTGVTAISAGVETSAALLASGAVATWGYNFYGELGDGTPTVPGRPRAQLVRGIGGAGNLGGVAAIAMGPHHTVAALDDSTAVAWGRNETGQLGDGTASRERALPVVVRGLGGGPKLTDVDGVAAGAEHSAAFLADGKAVAWGANAFGQLGDGTRSMRLTPVQVKSIAGGPTGRHATAIAARGLHTLALVSPTGKAFAWGRNEFGQVGDGTRTDRVVPTRVKR